MSPELLKLRLRSGWPATRRQAPRQQRLGLLAGMSTTAFTPRLTAGRQLATWPGCSADKPLGLGWLSLLDALSMWRCAHAAVLALPRLAGPGCIQLSVTTVDPTDPCAAPGLLPVAWRVQPVGPPSSLALTEHSDDSVLRAS